MTSDLPLAATHYIALDMAEVTDSLHPAISIIGGTAIAFTVFLCVVDYWSNKASFKELARLMTHSSMFWVRWPHDRIWSAPYGELAAEADRCESIIGYVHSKRRSPGKRFGDAVSRHNYNVEREIATYQHMLGTVRAAMNYAVSQGRGPQLPSN